MLLIIVQLPKWGKAITYNTGKETAPALKNLPAKTYTG